MVEVLTQPTAVFGWMLVALTWLVFRRSGDRTTRTLAAVLVVGYFAVATPLGANFAVGMLEAAADDDERCRRPDPGGVVVVLAGGQTGTATHRDDFSRLQEASLRRTIEGVGIAQSAPGVLLVVSGGLGGEIREADLMESFALRLGFPRERLTGERESQNTAESALRVAELATFRARPGMAVHLVTSALHMPRAAGVFRRRGMAVCGVSVDRRLVIPAIHEALIPQVSALRKTTDACHEAVGYLYYRFTGKM